MAVTSNEKLNWTIEMESVFINLIKENSHLWDIQHPYYSSRRLKHSSYREIGKYLRSKWPECGTLFTFANLITKFSSLCGRYKKEWKKQKQINDEMGGNFIPKWEHYQHLSFLEDTINKESDQSYNLGNISKHNSSEISPNEDVGLLLKDNAVIKLEMDIEDSSEELQLSTVPHSSLFSINSFVETNGTEANTGVSCENNCSSTNNLDARLKHCSHTSSTTDNQSYVIKALETLTDSLRRSNSAACKIASGNADENFGHFVGSVLATIPDSLKKEKVKIRVMELLTEAKYNIITEKYTVAEFEDGVRVIPTCWLTEDKNNCLWPKCTDEIRITRLIESLTVPDKTNWALQKVLKIFGTTNDYRRGPEKRKRRVHLSDLTSGPSNDEETQIKRSRVIKVSSDESETEDHQISDVCKSTTDSSLNKSSLESSILSSIIVTSSPTNADSLSSSSRDKRIQEEEVKCTDETDKGFMDLIIQKLDSVSRRLKVVEDNILLAKSSIMEADAGILADIMKIFPVISDSHMENLEIFLLEDENEKLVVAALKGIGGSDENQLITNILKRCISDNVAELYSWMGAKQKKAFNSLKFSKVILECVRYHKQNITEDSFAVIVSNWLRHARQRRERQEGKLKNSRSEV